MVASEAVGIVIVTIGLCLCVGLGSAPAERLGRGMYTYLLGFLLALPCAAVAGGATDNPSQAAYAGAGCALAGMSPAIYELFNAE